MKPVHKLALSMFTTVKGRVAYIEEFKRVKDLDYSDVPSHELTGDYLAGWRGLERLNLSDCSAFDSAAFRDLIKRCPMLSYLSLDGCRQITDDDVNCVNESCRFLKVLDLSNCRRLTKLHFNVPSKLEVLRVKHSRNVTSLKVVQADCLREVMLNGLGELAELHLPESVKQLSLAHGTLLTGMILPNLTLLDLTEATYDLNDLVILLRQWKVGRERTVFLTSEDPGSDVKLHRQLIVTSFPSIKFRGEFIRGKNVERDFVTRGYDDF